MRYASALICVSTFVMIATSSPAIDRSVDMIDEIEARYRVYDAIDTAGVLVRSETALAYDDDWSLIVNVGWSRILEKTVEQQNMWHVAFGPKMYLLENTRLTILAQADWTSEIDDFLAAGGTVMLEQRLINADAKLSPYVQVACSFLDVGAAPWSVDADADFTSWVVNLVLANDALLTPSATLTTRLELFDAIHSSDPTFKNWADGWAASVGLKYYFQ